jgi:predicted Zn-dependent protease
VTEFTDLVNRDPANPWNRYSLAIAYTEAGRPTEAVAEFEAGEAMAVVPAYHVHQGRALLMVGRWQDAMKEAEIARRQAPDNAAPLALLGRSI